MNPNGYPATLSPAPPGNGLALKHGTFSPARREPRAEEVAASIMAEPHVLPIDHAGALEIGRLTALVESLESALAEGPINPRSGNVRAVVDLRLRASKRLTDLLAAFGMTPRARFDFAARLASANDLQRRLDEIERGE